MEDLFTVKGKVVHYIYHNQENLFTVAKFELHQIDEKEITITGYLPLLPKDIYFILNGNYIEHPRYGMQFQVLKYEQMLPEERESIINYLSGANFPGIGRKYAETIVDFFGEQALEIMKENPAVIDTLPKLSKKRKESLMNGLITQDKLQNSIDYFTMFGFSIRTIMKIDAAFGKEAIEVLTENPYRLVSDIDGIGFKTADKFATHLGFPFEHPYRLQAAIVALVMEMCMKNGDSYVYWDQLLERVQKELSGFDFSFDDLLEEIVKEERLVVEGERIYHPSQYNAETTIASYLNKFPEESIPRMQQNEFELFLPKIQETINITYSEKQVESMRTFFEEDLMILTGGPGTGKTTVVRGIVSMFKILYPHYSIALCAPTGRAAKRLTELTGVPSYTIHSLLKWDLETNTFGCNEKEPLVLDLLIIDEFSMVDQFLFANLAKAGRQIKKLLIIGDEDQLPSVSPGKLLKDIIESNLFPLVRLDKIFRQKEGSDVITLAHQIREGKIDVLETAGDVKFLEIPEYKTKDAICNVVAEALNKGYSIEDIQVLSPKYNGLVGIDALNHSLQYLCNPQSEWKKEVKMGYRVFREGDKLLQLKNQTDDNVFNGDIGMLVEIDDTNPRDVSLFVDFEGNIVEYRQERFFHLTHAYCISIHKSQGSEYPIVIIPFVKENRFMLSKRLIYTGVSRAKKSLVLVGEKRILENGIQKRENIERKTTLIQKIEGE